MIFLPCENEFVDILLHSNKIILKKKIHEKLNSKHKKN